MDDPQLIVDGAMEQHYDMIKQFKGVPGVIPSRFKEGMQIKHCALSLVGEPIMYPEINKFLDILHSRRISSFLVGNSSGNQSERMCLKKRRTNSRNEKRRGEQGQGYSALSR